MEDVDLRLRLIKAGYPFSFIREAAVCHPWRPRGGWRQLKQHQQSTFIYLSIHPDERNRINSIYYLEMLLRGFIKTTIPGVLKFRGKGLAEELLQHLSFLQTAFYLLDSKRFSDD
jgi:GT2 family glycosyltransferase